MADYTLKLKLHGILQLEVYMDAAFASHTDSKSQSGIVVFLGGAMVFGASWKQKCVMKLPTESKLVALPDHALLLAKRLMPQQSTKTVPLSFHW
jgi:hypothetical protein